MIVRARSIDELLPGAVAYVRGLGLPHVDGTSKRRVAVRLPKGRVAVMSARDCRWSVLDAVYRPSPRSQSLWRLIRLIPLHLLPVCSTIAENERWLERSADAVELLEGLGSSSVVYVGGSQPRLSIVVAALSDDDTVSGVTRVGYDMVSCEQVAREDRQLGALSAIQVPGVRWPTVTAFTQAGAVRACTFSAPAGRSAELGTPSREQLLRAHAAIVSETIHDRLLGDVLPGEVPHVLAGDILGGMPEDWRNVSIPCSMVHGDFAPWNARVVGEDVFLFDWTNGAMSGPAFYDRLYLEHQLERLMARGRPDQCAARLADIARAEYSDLDAGLVVGIYLLWRLADAVANESDSDVTETATIWNAFRDGVGRA